MCFIVVYSPGTCKCHNCVTVCILKWSPRKWSVATKTCRKCNKQVIYMVWCVAWWSFNMTYGSFYGIYNNIFVLFWFDMLFRGFLLKIFKSGIILEEYPLCVNAICLLDIHVMWERVVEVGSLLLQHLCTEERAEKSVTRFLSWNLEPKNICHSLTYPWNCISETSYSRGNHCESSD